MDELSLEQIKRLCDQSFAAESTIRLMPDVHAGAGRIMSRKKAFEILKMEDYEKAMEGIYSTSVNKDTIDESPMAYKNIDDIIANISPTANILKIVKPIYNYKASQEGG